MSDYVVNTLSKGGWAMVPIILCSLFGWIALLRIWMRLAKMDRGNKEAIRYLTGEIGELRAMHQSDVVLSRLALAFASVRHIGTEALEARLEEVQKWLSIQLEKGFPTLGVAATLAPLLGLFGTVSGIINTFRLIRIFGSDNPALFSAGIAEALLTTQTGLMVAVPLMVGQVLLVAKAEKMEERIDLMGRKFIDTLEIATSKREEAAAV